MYTKKCVTGSFIMLLLFAAQSGWAQIQTLPTAQALAQKVIQLRDESTGAPLSGISFILEVSKLPIAAGILKSDSAGYALAIIPRPKYYPKSRLVLLEEWVKLYVPVEKEVVFNSTLTS